MTIPKNTRRLLLGAALVGAIALGSLSYMQYASPLGSSKLFGKSYLGQVPTTCETCSQTLFYRVNSPQSNCNITLVTTDERDSIDDPETVQASATLSLQDFIDFKGTDKYVFDAVQNNSFKEICHDFSA